MVVAKKYAVKAEEAAQMLSLKHRDFMDLVAQGSLPQPIKLGKHTRWVVVDIEAALMGSKVEPEAFVV